MYIQFTRHRDELIASANCFMYCLVFSVALVWLYQVEETFLKQQYPSVSAWIWSAQISVGLHKVKVGRICVLETGSI